jgi:flavin reductase (DIM6/NTAB) family NADH-FMN oxidoreductase RutF
MSGISFSDVAVPRLAVAPFALECRQHVALAFGPGRVLLVGEVLRLHAREGLIDKERTHVDFDVYRPIGRLFGNLYAARLTRESHAQWLARIRGGNGAGDPSDQNQ